MTELSNFTSEQKDGRDIAGALDTLDALAFACHERNARWWFDINTGEPLNRNKGELLMLMVSEIAEAMEGERKDLMDEHLPDFKSVEVELADLLIRVFDYAGAYGLRLSAAFIAKSQYNLARLDHQAAARSAPGGKKW